MHDPKVNIWGSCVSRDGVEFAIGVTVDKYCARQSVVSSVASPVSSDIFSALSFKEGTHPFHQKVVVEDFLKTSLAQLAEKERESIFVFDLIEERVPIGVTKCGTYITLSQAATSFTNVGSLLADRIEPFSTRHLELFERALVGFARSFSDRTVYIHRALYAPGDWSFEHANCALSKMYDFAESIFTSSVVVEVDARFRVSSEEHKWGVAPYHYADSYYRDFVARLSSASGEPIKVKPNFTLQNTKKLIDGACG